MDGKVVVVTGAGRGVGRGVALLMAAEALDAASLSQKRGLTVPLARAALVARGLID
jgi:NAD(P)-dependent dehydrogenase (short-subunit alcohol dehydrogenase family)